MNLKILTCVMAHTKAASEIEPTTLLHQVMLAHLTSTGEYSLLRPVRIATRTSYIYPGPGIGNVRKHHICVDPPAPGG